MKVNGDKQISLKSNLFDMFELSPEDDHFLENERTIKPNKKLIFKGNSTSILKNKSKYPLEQEAER